MSKKDDLLALAPLESYQAPDLPTLEESEPEILKKMPTRWKNKAMITAMVGVLAAGSLAGCNANDDRGHVSDVNDYYDDYKSHHGGEGGGPIYIAYLTEQEALRIVRNQLEDVGLNFNSVPPSHNIIYNEGEWNEQKIGLDLFDEENNIGIALVNNWWRNNSDERAIGIVEELTQETEGDGIHISVIFNKRDEVWYPSNGGEIEEILEEYLNLQVQTFIQHLQEEGIID